MGKYVSPFYSLIDQNGQDSTGGFDNISTGSGKSKYTSPFSEMAIIVSKKKKQSEDAILAAMKQQQEADKNTSKENGGNILTKAGRFIKDIGVGIKNDAVNAYTGIRDVVEGKSAADSNAKISQELLKRSKEGVKRLQDAMGSEYNNPNSPKWQSPEIKKIIEENNRSINDFKASQTSNIDKNNKQFKEGQDVSAKKTAFAAASTFLNATMVYGAAEAGVKAVGGQIAKNITKDAVGQMIKSGRTEILEQIIKSGSKEAAEQAIKTVAENTSAEVADSLFKQALKKAAPEALMGSAYGAIETGKQNPNATASDYVKGATIGGVVGGAVPLVGEGLKKVSGEIVSKMAEKSASSKAAQAIIDDGLTAAERINDKGVKAKINSIFNPIKNLAEETQQSFKNRAGSEYASKVQANALEKKITQIAEKEGLTLDMNLVDNIEKGTVKGEFADTFRTTLDQIRKDATDAGMDIGYRENYVPHIWKQSPEEIQKIAKSKGFQMQAIAEGKRVVPTYQEGIELGLTPKHTNPAKMVAEYAQNIEKARSNVALFKDLQDQGVLVKGKTPAGWKMITAEGFPKSYQGAPMSAPPEVARVINNIFGKSDSIIDRGLRKTAHFNSLWQDVALAGGVPHTPANFFTFSQMMKETSLGIGQMVTGQPLRGAKTIYSPMAAFVRSFSEKESTKFQMANEQFIQKLAKAGAPINFAEASADSAVKRAFTWDKMFNEPTFGRFMPNLQLGTAKNVYNNLARKMGSEEAMAATADIMKKMYGITDQMATGRAQGVQDLIGSVAFAPKYRESIINVLTNTLKSLSPTTYHDVSYSLNRRLAVGLGATYLIYDQLNKETTGHGMAENPQGKELALAIPYGGKDKDGNQKVVYIPFMPSFLTLPRAAVDMVSGAARGDQQAVVKGASSFASMPIQTMSQLANNQDYFGRPIYIDEKTAQLTRKEQDSPTEALKKQGAYLLGQSSPSAVRAVIGAAQGKPLEQNLAVAGEAPVRFGESSIASTRNKSYSPSEVNNEFYKVYNPANAKRRIVSAEVTSLIKQGKISEARRRANEYNASLNGKFGNVSSKFDGTQAWNSDWNDMIKELIIPTSERSFKAREKS